MSWSCCLVVLFYEWRNQKAICRFLQENSMFLKKHLHTWKAWQYSRQLFSKIIGFTQEHFQPFFSSRFLMDLSIQHFIFNCPTLRAVLQDHQGLGAHTDIVEITASTTTTFIWVHQGCRPFGHIYQHQCPVCSRLSTIGPKFDNSNCVYFKCSFAECPGISIFQLPADAQWLYKGPPIKGDSRGTWLHIRKTTSSNVEKKAAVKDDLGVEVDDDDAGRMEED